MSVEQVQGKPEEALPVLAGRYQLQRVIARGGMGEIWEAIQLQLQRKVAIKLINPHAGQGWGELVKRFEREATALARLNHVNVVTIYDHGQTDDGQLYIAMEFLEGKTLAELIANEGPLDFPRVSHLGVQICRGLREAHAAGLIHRDLKLSNVLIINGGSDESERDQVKVVDFGLAKFQAARDPTQRGEITAGEVLLGSPKYMSPEQICGDPVDARADVYAVGVLLYAMVTGALPYEGATTAEIIRKHLKDAPPPFASIGYGRPCPPALANVILGCLEKDPQRRPADAKALIGGLKEAYRSVVSPAFDPAEARAMGLDEGDAAPPKSRMLSESGWRQVNDLNSDTSGPSLARPLSEIQASQRAAEGRGKTIAAVLLGVAILVGAAFALGRSTPSAEEAGSEPTVANKGPAPMKSAPPKPADPASKPADLASKPADPASKPADVSGKASESPASLDPAKAAEGPKPQDAVAKPVAKPASVKPRPSPKPKVTETPKPKPPPDSDITLSR
ncbi:MAG: protein kinase [Deltaproteobacteria bacterium]|nr:protein kinase [Deltaproteobacteria bacterium]